MLIHQPLKLNKNLLDQARIDIGKVSFNIIPVTMSELLYDVETMLNVVAQTKQVQLGSDIAPGFPDTIPGDPHWLRQILVNLVSNAIKFTYKGSVHIHIYLSDNSQWAVQVSDTRRL